MKKIYTKPYIVVETFQLDAAVANSCSDQGKYTLGFGMTSCNLEDNKGSTEFQGSHYFGNACDHDVQVEGDENDEICYHGPTVSAESLFMYS